MSWRRVVAALAALVLWLPAVAAPAAASAPAPAAGPPPLRLALASNPNAGSLLVAEAEGLFAAEGLAVKVLPCAFGRICLQRLLDGEADVATVADTPITIASFTRRDFAIVATMATSGRDHRMIVRTDRGIRSAADLERRRIGTQIGASGHYFTETFLRFHGVDPAAVTLVALDAKDPVGPLLRGEVDALGVFEPHGRDALRRLGAQAVALPTPGFFTVTFNIVATRAVLATRGDDLQRLLRAARRAGGLMREHPERAHAAIAARSGLDAATVETMMKDFDFRLELAQPLITTLEAQARWALREQIVPRDARMPDYLDFIDAGPLGRVDARAVRLAR